MSARALADPFGFGLGVIAAFAVPYFVLGSGGGFIKYFRAMHGRTNRSTVRAYVYLVLMSLAASALSFWLLHEVLALSREWAPWNRVAFVPVLVCLAVHAGVMLLVGLMGADYPDGAREWVARIGTGLTLVCAAWLALFAIAIWGPWAVAWSLAHYGMTALTVLDGVDRHDRVRRDGRPERVVRRRRAGGEAQVGTDCAGARRRGADRLHDRISAADLAWACTRPSTRCSASR